MRRFLMPPAAALALGMSMPANAAEDSFQLWLNPSVAFDLDDNTGLEIETAQRLRPASAGPDTFYARLWVNQKLDESFAISGGIERRINDGGPDETRLLQQVTARSGVLRARARIEQRFIDNADQTGWRLRTRLGVNVPLTADKRLHFVSSAETNFTLRATSNGGDTGLTALRTQIGLEFDVSDNLALGLGYLRNQDFLDERPDRVGHAPLLSLDYSF